MNGAPGDKREAGRPLRGMTKKKSNNKACALLHVACGLFHGCEGLQHSGCDAAQGAAAGAVGQLLRGYLLHRHWRLQCDDQRAGWGVAVADVAVRGFGVEVNGVAGFDVVRRLAVAYFERAGEEIEELAAGVLVRSRHTRGLEGKELGKVGVELAVGHEVAEALEEVGGVVDAGLRKAHSLAAPVDAEERLRLRLEEVAEVLGEDHGDAGEVAQGGDDAARLQLREKAGGESGVAAEFDQAHRLFQTQAFDAFADAFLCDEGFCCLAVD